VSAESSINVIYFAISPPSIMRVRLLFVSWIVSSCARRATRLVSGCQWIGEDGETWNPLDGRMVRSPGCTAVNSKSTFVREVASAI
jgi:hypothetical protein